MDFDTTGLGAWDSSLLTFLLQAVSHCEAHDLEFKEENLPADVACVLGLARAIPEQEIDRDEEEASLVARLDTKGLSGCEAFLASVTFTGEVADGFIRLFLFRLRLRSRDFWVVVQSNSSGALPIVTLIAFLVGMIIAFLGAVVLRRFGADYYASSGRTPPSTGWPSFSTSDGRHGSARGADRSERADDDVRFARRDAGAELSGSVG